MIPTTTVTPMLLSTAMLRVSIRFIAFCGFLALSIIGAAQETFNYDKNLPLDENQHEVGIRNGVRILLLNIAVTANVRADCLLVAPVRSKGKTGAVVWMHSGGFFEQLPDALLLAHAGAISLLIDPIVPDWGGPPERWHESMVQAIISVRRGVDLLIRERNDVDPQRIAYVGHSYGALIGVDAAAIDHRFRAAVFEVGLPGMSVHIRTAEVSFANEIRQRLGDRLDSALRQIEPLDAIHYVDRLAPTALLFQSAHLDPGISDEQAQSFFDAASEPKILRWYDTAHEVIDIAAISDRARFLASQLALHPIEPILKAKIGIR